MHRCKSPADGRTIYTVTHYLEVLWADGWKFESFTSVGGFSIRRDSISAFTPVLLVFVALFTRRRRKCENALL